MKAVKILMFGDIENPVFDGYGFLYNWYAARDANFAPTDWSVMSDYEIGYCIGGTGAKLNYKEIGTTYWNTANGTNTKGFSARGGGYRTSAGVYSGIKDYFYYWSKDETGGNGNYARLNDSDGVNTLSLTASKKSGMSVRLYYTGAGTPTTVTDYDGNVYDVVLVNGYYLTKQNWKCTKLNNGTSIPIVTDATDWGNLTTLGRCAYDNDLNNV